MFFEQPDARGLTTANPDLDAARLYSEMKQTLR
jgi:hypothetical protein